jgi:post-segregation antitoxin (ccd killing protein)
MRTRLLLDDDLVERARDLTGIAKTSALVNAGLEALIERESSRRQPRLGTNTPTQPSPPQRRGH